MALPREVRKRGFETAKGILLRSDNFIAEDAGLKALDAAATSAAAAAHRAARGSTEGRRSFGRAAEEARAVAQRLGASSGEEAGQRMDGDKAAEAAWLKSWRPDFNNSWPYISKQDQCAAPSRPEDEEEGPLAAPEPEAAEPSSPPLAELVSPDDPMPSESAEPEEDPLLRRKRAGDGAARAEEYSTALTTYEALLEDPRCLSDLRAAVASNAALCSLKLAPEQKQWGSARRLLRRTVQLCDESLAINPIAKAHFRRGCALECLEDFRGARLAYAEAALLAPEDALVRQAADRALCYEDEDAGGHGDEERVRAARARVLAADPFVRSLFPGAGRRSAAVANGSSVACCACSGRASAESCRFAAPCGHGPFCGACRSRLDKVGGLRICPVCMKSSSATSREALVTEWRGVGQLLKADPRLRKSTSLVGDGMSTGVGAANDFLKAPSGEALPQAAVPESVTSPTCLQSMD